VYIERRLIILSILIYILHICISYNMYTQIYIIYIWPYVKWILTQRFAYLDQEQFLPISDFNAFLLYITTGGFFRKTFLGGVWIRSFWSFIDFIFNYAIIHAIFMLVCGCVCLRPSSLIPYTLYVFLTLCLSIRGHVFCSPPEIGYLGRPSWQNNVICPLCAHSQVYRCWSQKRLCNGYFAV